MKYLVGVTIAHYHELGVEARSEPEACDIVDNMDLVEIEDQAVNMSDPERVATVVVGTVKITSETEGE